MSSTKSAQGGPREGVRAFHTIQLASSDIEEGTATDVLNWFYGDL